MIDLSRDQKTALDGLKMWLNSPDKDFITLGGYAGTGKTSLVSILRHQLYKENPNFKVAFCSYTGKAARILKSKLIESEAVFRGDYVGTIHSLLYEPITNSREEIVGWNLKLDEIYHNLIIIDEASMLDEQIWRDLLSYHVPIIAVGDHGQLPPIKGSFNLMQNPQIKLEEIHRQAKDNPIIRLSVLARTEGEVPYGSFSKKVRKVSGQDSDARESLEEDLRGYGSDTLILCGYNSTRMKINQFIRNAKDFDTPEPQINDRVICLRNNTKKKIYNGMTGTIKFLEKADHDWYESEIKMDNDELLFKGLISSKQFNSPEPLNFTNKRSESMKGDLFDFGYTLTVHKAQGSEAPKVILFEERFKQMADEMWRRWLYTGITRAQKELIIVGA